MTKKLSATLWKIYIGAALVAFLAPIVWIFLTAFKRPRDLLRAPFDLFAPTLENFDAVFSGGNFWHYTINSVIVTVVSTSLSLLFGIFAGYSLGRLRVRGFRQITFGLFFAKLFPAVILVIPFFLVLKGIHGIDNIWLLAIAYTSFSLPLVTWILWGFFRGLPEGLEEAAALDGCTTFGAMVRIMIPLAKPGIAVAAIFAAMESWNEFLFALSLTGKNAETLPVMASTFVTSEAILWGPMSAAGAVLMVPLFIFTLVVQKQLVSGLTVGAVK